jgi:rRNA-processing protein FCF1
LGWRNKVPKKLKKYKILDDGSDPDDALFHAAAKRELPVK